jgi:hypothetical protein
MEEEQEERRDRSLEGGEEGVIGVFIITFK